METVKKQGMMTKSNRRSVYHCIPTINSNRGLLIIEVILIIMKIKKRVEFTWNSHRGMTQDCPSRFEAGSLADMESVVWLSGAKI